MQRILEYHRFAEDCRKLAESLVNPRQKQKLQDMAVAWDMLAIERKLNSTRRSLVRPSAEHAAGLIGNKIGGLVVRSRTHNTVLRESC